MAVYNGKKHLREAIESILNQTFTNFEFIIVNDCSTDSSLEIIQSYEDERIKVINNERNIGLTKSLNKGIKQARGEYIARQDADDISLPNRFEKQLKYFEEHPKTALLGTSIYVIDENGNILEKRIASPSPNKTLLKGNRFTHGSLMFKRSVINELGQYNELFKYSQDYELCLRISKYYEVKNLEAPLYKLRFHSSSIASTKIKEQQLYASLAQKLAKNELSKESLKMIRDNIFNLYSLLNRQEKIVFHKAVAYSHIQYNDLESARREYKRIFRLNPFDMENNLYLMLSHIGKGSIRKMHQIYRFSRYVSYKMFRLEI